MSGIVSGVGLFSGLPVQDLIDQLISLEARPLEQMQKRLEAITTQRAAFFDLSARLLALKSSASSFDQRSFFQHAKAISSNPSVFTATAADGAVEGAYQFSVHSLATKHQIISSGYADSDRTAIGSGTLSIEIGNGKLSRRSFLDDLNGSEGIGRGVIEIEDQSGQRAEIDLTAVLTIQDVVEAINRESRIDVLAQVRGDSIELVDISSAPIEGGVLAVNDVGEGSIAADLGIAQSVTYDSSNPTASRTVLGRDINDVHENDKLSLLNDGNGIRRRKAGNDLIFASASAGSLSRATRFFEMGGSEGMDGGLFEIATRDGHKFNIDLRSEDPSLTVGDVIDRINSEADGRVSVQIKAGTNRLTFTDLTTGDEPFAITDVEGTTAADLGVAGTASGSAVTTRDLLSEFYFAVELNDTLKRTTHLAQLNDGNGISLGVFEIRSRDGKLLEVDLTGGGIETVGDVIDAINDAADAEVPPVKIKARLEPGTNLLQIEDQSGGNGTFEVKDLSGRSAQELGFTSEASGNTITSAKLLRITTLGDVVRAINHAPGNTGFTASLDGNGIKITHADGTTFVVESGSGSKAAEDLGLTNRPVQAGSMQSRDLIAGLNTVLLRSLNGGQGVTPGRLTIHGKDGALIQVDISGDESLWDILQAINDQDLGVRASINSAGTGILLTDETGATGTLSVVDNDTAAALGLSGASTTGTSLDSGNLQLQYISEATLLGSMNHGSGIGQGKFKITNSMGVSFSVVIGSNQTTVGDVISQINNAGLGHGIKAALNENGDGIVILDSNDGDGSLSVTDTEGQVAKHLNFLGESTVRYQDVEDPDQPGTYITVAEQIIDGSFEFKIIVDSDDTLNDVAAKINSAGIPVSATIINDGSSNNSYRLSLASGVTGSRGELVFDPGTTGMSMNTLVGPKDAVVFFGGESGADPVIIRSSNNTLTNVIDDVTIDLLGTSDGTVDLTVSKDIDSIVEGVKKFVTSYNGLVEHIGKLTFFDSETMESGILRTDPTIRRVESRLTEMITAPIEGNQTSTTRLANVGITFQNGGQLEFDEAQFREVLAEDPQSVEDLFALSRVTESTDPITGDAEEEFEGLGVGYRIEEVLEFITRNTDGLLALKDDSLEDQEDLVTSRAEQLLNRLDAKRARLEREFAGLEQSLSTLSGQQNAISLLAGRVPSIYS